MAGPSTHRDGWRNGGRGPSTGVREGWFLAGLEARDIDGVSALGQEQMAA